MLRRCVESKQQKRLGVNRELLRYEPGPEEDAHSVIEIAFNQGVQPRKGFDMLLGRHGLCSAITVLGGVVHNPDSGMPADVRDYCVHSSLRPS